MSPSRPRRERRGGRAGSFTGMLALLLLLGAAQPLAAKPIALLIGISHYADPALTLSGPAHDVAAMRQVLASKWGFSAADIHVLVNERATRENILREIGQLGARSAPGDLVLIYYSGHGTSALDSSLALPLPDSTGAWAPYDVQLSGSTQGMVDSLIVGRSALRPLLLQLDRDREVVVFTDSCYSGNLVRNVKRSKGGTTRLLPGAATNAAAGSRGNRSLPPPYPYQHVVMLSAASDNETAKDINEDALASGIRTIDGLPHGTFTDGLLRILNGQLGTRTGEAMSYASVQQLLRANMARYGVLGDHEPQILPSLSDQQRDAADKAFLRTGMARGSAGQSPPPTRTTFGVQLEGVSAGLRARLGAIPGIVFTSTAPDWIVQEDAGGLRLMTGRGDLIRDGKTDSGTLVDRVASEVFLRRMLDPTLSGGGLRAEMTPASRGGTFLEGEVFRLAVGLQHAATVLVVSLASDGQFSVLYPASDREMAALSPSEQRTIPALQDPPIGVLPPFGLDLMAIVAFPAAPDHFKQWITDRPIGKDDRIMQELAVAIATAGPRVQSTMLELRTAAKR